MPRVCGLLTSHGILRLAYPEPVADDMEKVRASRIEGKHRWYEVAWTADLLPASANTDFPMRTSHIVWGMNGVMPSRRRGRYRGLYVPWQPAIPERDSR